MKCSALGAGFGFGWKKLIMIIVITTIIITGFWSGLLHQNWLFLTFPYSLLNRGQKYHQYPDLKNHRLLLRDSNLIQPLPTPFLEPTGSIPGLLLLTGEISESHFLKPAPCPDLHLHLGLFLGAAVVKVTLQHK